MRNFTIKASVFAALSLAAGHTMAAGFVTLPTSGSSAYVQCRTTGNFGSQDDSSFPTSPDDACVAPNGVGAALAINSTPETGFALQLGATTSPITAFGETVATLNERVFKNGGTCIYAKQLIMSHTATHDYNPTLGGPQKLEVNDYAFGGYTGAVSAAYAKAAESYSSAFRIGRTFTSVQMQADPSTPSSVAPGFLVLPGTNATAGTEITGVGQTSSPGTVVPGTGQQDAPFSSSWVDFTTDVTAGVDEDGTSNPASPNMYIKQACASATVSPVANSLKIRQTGQETQPWVTITASSRAPSSTITP